MLILYDRDCGFCAWTVATLLRRDRRGALRAATIQGPEGTRLLADLPAGRRLASWHVVDDAGRRHSGGAGLIAVLGTLPGGAALAALLGRMPQLTERGYGWVAAHRRPAVEARAGRRQGARPRPARHALRRIRRPLALRELLPCPHLTAR